MRGGCLFGLVIIICAFIGLSTCAWRISECKKVGHGDLYCLLEAPKGGSR